MGRAPFQILTIPFFRGNEEILFCLFKRADMEIWQWIAGGGEGEESPIEAARRECFEEANIDKEGKYIELKTITSIPSYCFKEFKDSNIFILPEYAFGVEVVSSEIIISEEHSAYQWVNYEEAIELLKYDGNKTALWELKNLIENNWI